MSAVFENPLYEHADWKTAAAQARPTNYRRNLYHVGNTIVIVWLVMHLLSPLGMVLTAGGFALFAWTCELVRRRLPLVNALLMRLFAPLAHPHEYHDVNSATWIVTALTVVALLFSKPIACVGVVVVGFADPTAAIVGRRWGRTRIAGGRTLEGSAAFVGVGTAVALALLWIYVPGLTLAGATLMALAAAVVGAVAELYSRVDDNLSIPIAASAAAWLMMLALGLNPGHGWLVSQLL